MASGLTYAHAFADSIDFDFYVSDPSINLTFNYIQPHSSGYTSTPQANNELLYPINFNGQMKGSSTLANDFAKNYPNHIGLDTKDSNPDALDVYVDINMSINGSPVVATSSNNAIVLAHEHKSNHNWFIATSAGNLFNGSNKNHSDWGLNIATQDGNQYCLKAVNLDYAVVVYKGQCNNNSTYSNSNIGSNISGRYDLSHAEIKTFTFSPDNSISKVAFTYDGTHDGIYCGSNCDNHKTPLIIEQFANIYSTTSGNDLAVNILSGLNDITPVSFNSTFSESEQLSFKNNYNKSESYDSYQGLQAAYFIVNGNLAITDNNNVTTTFPISLAYSCYNCGLTWGTLISPITKNKKYGWSLGSAMGSSIHNENITLTNNGISYCLTGKDNGNSAAVSTGVCSN